MSNLAELKMSDLVDITNFSKWISENITRYDGKVPNDHLLIYLDYIKNMAKESKNISHLEWFSLIDNLEGRLKSMVKKDEKRK